MRSEGLHSVRFPHRAMVHIILFDSWSGSTRFRIPNKPPLQCYSWVDGRLTKAQVTSSAETIWPEVRSSMSQCAQTKAKQQWDFKNPKYKLHVTRGKFTIFHPTIWNDLTPLFRTPERRWRFGWNQPWALHKYASPLPRHQRRTMQ